MDGSSQNTIAAPAPEPAAAHHKQIFGWFRKILPVSFFDSLESDLAIVQNSRLFTLTVTAWMMIMQRLSSDGTLAGAVQELIHGHGRELLDPCKRAREQNISAGTGGYSQARQQVPVAAARRIAQHSFEQLHGMAQQGTLRDRMFLLDGSSIRLAHTPSVVKAYPQAENQYGPSHWPVLRIAVMHHAVTGLAMAPQFGPMYGPKAVSEQGLAEALIDALPPASILMADRNFGVFSVLWRAHRQGHQVLTRLSKPRALCLADGDLSIGSDRAVVWSPSARDRKTHPDLTAGACIEGRIIAAHPKDMKEPLYLFTTCVETAETVTELYRERWNIETDLRSLKEQVKLHTIPARSPHLVEVELLMAIASYNLIRAVMGEAARQLGISPRRISFSGARTAFGAFSRAVAHLNSEAEFDHHWRLLLRSLGQLKLPTRKRPPQPRSVWPKPQPFPTKKAT